MSGRHWLERNPKDSPGLQRIREAQQAAAAAKAEEMRKARELQRSIEAEMERDRQRKLKELAEKLKRETLIPALKEIRDYANNTGLYPPPSNCSPTGCEFDVIVKRAEVVDGDDYLEMYYAHKSVGYDEQSNGDPDHPYSTHVVSFPSAHFVGIRLRYNSDSDKIELFSKREVVIPAVEKVPPHWVGQGKASYHSDGTRGHPAYTQLEDCWVPLPNDEASKKKALTDAFHDPMSLGKKGLWEIEERENQTRSNPLKGFWDIARGLVGLK